MTGFDPAQFARLMSMGHGGRLGVVYRDHGRDGADPWVELALPAAAEQAGADGSVALGPVATLMDMATSLAVWARRGRFLPHVTLDLRLDRLRGAVPGRTVIGRGACYRLTPRLAFVRGEAHDGDPADPVAHVAGTFMLMDAGA